MKMATTCHQRPGVSLLVLVGIVVGCSSLFLAASAQDLACGTSEVQIPRNYLPVEAEYGDFPWFVRLNIRCTGVILGRQWIVTAAHCVFAKGSQLFAPKDIQVYINDLVLSMTDPGETVYGVDRVIPHPMFDPVTLDYDYALLHLSQMLTWSSYVKPICLLQDCEAEVTPGPNVTCLSIGWGSDRAAHGAGFIDDRLKKQLIPPVPRSFCQSVLSTRPYLEDFILTQQMTCAGFVQGGIDDCQSDGGGPMICRSDTKPSFYLHGLSSFGYGCGLPRGYYRIFSRPCAITSWIIQSTRPRAS